MVDNLFFLSNAQDVSGGDHVTSSVMDMVSGTNTAKDAFGNTILVPVAAAKLFMNVLVTTVIAAGSFRIGLYTRASSATITSADTEICAVSIPSGSAAGEMFSVGCAQNGATFARYVGGLIDVDTDDVTGNVDIWLDINPVTTQKLPH